MIYTPKKKKEINEKTKKWLNTAELNFKNAEDLRDIIRYHEWAYYVAFEPTISDFEFDQLFKKLESFEQINPNLVPPNSPTQRVSSDLQNSFNSVEHLIPMLSLNNSYNAEDLNDFETQIRKLANIPEQEIINYCVEPKFDGGSIAFVYENDLLIRSATRGNGIVGEDVTLNAKALPSIPLQTNFSKHNIYKTELRGEAVIRKDIFDKVNSRRQKAGKSVFANPRNAAAGGLRMKNPNDSRKRGIEVFIFQMGLAIDKDEKDQLQVYNTQFDQIEMLGKLDFKIPQKAKKRCHGIQEVVDFINIWQEKREEYPYEIDGMVVKVDDRSIQEKCGYTGHHPRWAIAFKFKAKQATTKLLKVEYQVGKIGSITPVAKLQPVQLAGVSVSSVSLHNEEFIVSKDLRINDTVLVERAGDVIPYIVKSFPELRAGTEEKLIFPKFCPINHTEQKIELVKEESEAAWRCPNCVCGAQDLQRMIFHVSKNAMDIDGFGKSYVERFYDLGWLKNIADIYTLDYEAIAELEGFGEKSSENLKISIENAKKNQIGRAHV